MRNGKIAEERIQILFNQAEEKKFEDHPKLSDRYVEIARRIGERTQTPMPSRLKRKFCSNCGSFWKIGLNCRKRLNSENRTIEYRCEECGEVERYGY